MGIVDRDLVRIKTSALPSADFVDIIVGGNPQLVVQREWNCCPKNVIYMAEGGMNHDL
jgi:hypothetical protein